MATCVDVAVLLSCLVLCFCSMTCTSADDTLQRELLARIEALEKQGQEQGKLLMTQTATIQQMESKMDNQNAKISRQQKTMEHYKQRIETLEQTLEEMRVKSSIDVSQEANEKSDDVAEKTQVNVAINKGVVPQRRLVLGNTGAVAFHAVISAFKEVNHIGNDQKIVFPDVRINLGGGYHNLHGLFISPQSGLYLFSTSILANYRNHVELSVHIMKNGNVLANAFAHGDSGRQDQGSVTVVTQLAVGDEVWVSLYGPADTSVWADSFDSFMGCLITPM